MSRIYKYKKILSVYETIIFDLDGTLYNSEQFYTGVFQDMGHWLVNSGFQETSSTWINCMMGLKYAKGNDYKKLIDDALKLLNIDPKIKKELLEIYKEHDCKYLLLHNNESHMLKHLTSCNKKMFIITNGQKQLQERKIKKLQLNQYMEEIIILEPLEGNVLKPDKAVFDYLNRKYQLGKTIMVGDRFDIDGMFAENCGIDFLGVSFYGD